MTPEQIIAWKELIVGTAGILVPAIVAFYQWKTRVELDRLAGAQRGGVEFERQRTWVAETVFPRRKIDAPPAPGQVSSSDTVGGPVASDVPGSGEAARQVDTERAG